MSEFVSKKVKSIVGFNDVEKLDIRVGEIIKVEDVVKSNDLMKLTVDFGDFERIILAGIKNERENPKEIENKQALFVVNMKPKEMFGIESEGMLFDLGYENKITPVLAMPEKKVPNGTCAG
jgi:methionine--tRNA ligase beta chain